MDMENKIDDIELLAFTDPFNGLVHILELLDLNRTILVCKQKCEFELLYLYLYPV